MLLLRRPRLTAPGAPPSAINCDWSSAVNDSLRLKLSRLSVSSITAFVWTASWPTSRVFSGLCGFAVLFSSRPLRVPFSASIFFIFSCCPCKL
ncbi:uncharacterized protein DS421_11g326590 [Arachis hypogaea]|nr:uncharacterized protein DS421_11g326590 [Arachis hypogaea]